MLYLKTECLISVVPALIDAGLTALELLPTRFGDGVGVLFLHKSEGFHSFVLH